jgi:tetratricopeptide (TPR) repeat protein
MFTTRVLLLASLVLSLASTNAAFAQKGRKPSLDGKPSSIQSPDKEFASGNAAADRKEWTKAAAHYTRAIEQQPDFAAAFLNRGRVSLFDGKLDAAVADFRKACELVPDAAMAHTWLAAGLLDKGEHDAARDTAAKALKLDAKQAFAWYIRGTAQVHKGELAKAIDDLTEAAKLSPNDAIIYNNRGIAYQKLGNEKNALADFERRDQLNGKGTASNDGSLSPAKRAAQERMKKAEQQYRQINALVEAHEDRIRAVRSIRVPPGVRPPQVDPVPAELLQRRAAAWNNLQDAIRAYKEIP